MTDVIKDDELTEQSRDVLDAIRRLVQVIRRSAQAAERRVGLSAAQLFVLRKLSEAPMLSVGELAIRTATSQSSVSEVVQRLVTAGLVLRQRSARDGRSVELTLSDAGRVLIGKAPQAIQDHILDGLSRMPARDRSELARLINKLLQETGIAQGPIKMLLEEDAVTSEKAVD